VGTFTLGYDGVTGRPLSLTYPNNQVTQYSYFPNTGDRRLQQITNLSPSSATISQYAYTYDPVGNVSTWSQQVGSSTPKVYAFGYDADNELKTAQVTGPTPLPVPSRYGYAYDAVGNQTGVQLDDAPSAATFNNRNELTQQQGGVGPLLFQGTVNKPATVTVQGQPSPVSPSNAFSGQAQVPTGTSNVVVSATDASGNTRTNTYQVTVSGGTTTYAYDLNGNLKNKTSGGVTTNYDWDAEGRLLDVKQGTTTLASFVYDGSGRRFQKIAGGVTHSYVYDGASINEERLSSGQTYDYVQGPGIDHPVAMRDQASVVSYYLADHLGSIVQTTNSAGTITVSRDYDPFGNPLAGAATAGYAFTGREWDPETSLYYYRARYYDPSVGRFLSEDPLPDPGFSLYAYVHNNPVGSIDPSGEEEICVHASSVFWAGYGPSTGHHIWPLRGVDPNGDVAAWFNLIYFSGGCASSLPQHAHLKNPPPNLPYTIYAETTGINTVVWKVSVGTTWLFRHGGQSGLQKLGAELVLCYDCCK
jgi:RHS repeat-associated protein